MKLSGVIIGSEKPKELGEFYGRIFGKPVWEDNEWYGFDINGGSLLVGYHSQVKGKNESPGRLIISIECDDVKAEFSRIKDLKAIVVAEPYQPSKVEKPNIWLATFADLDGNYFQLATPWSE